MKYDWKKGGGGKVKTRGRPCPPKAPPKFFPVCGSVSAPSHSLNEVRLERGGRGMVRTVGQLCRAMDRHNFSADSRMCAGRHDFGNRAGVRAVDELSEGSLQ